MLLVIPANHHLVDLIACVAWWVVRASALAYPPSWAAHQIVAPSVPLAPNAPSIWHASRINVAIPVVVLDCAVLMRDVKRSIIIPYVRAHLVLPAIHSLPALKCHVRNHLSLNQFLRNRKIFFFLILTQIYCLKKCFLALCVFYLKI